MNLIGTLVPLIGIVAIFLVATGALWYMTPTETLQRGLFFILGIVAVSTASYIIADAVYTYPLLGFLLATIAALGLTALWMKSTP